VLLLAVGYCAALSPYGLNLDDEGTLLYQIYRTYLGQVLYVDFHAGYTPGLFYWNAALFTLFGVNIVVLRLCLALINGLAVYCMYWLARRLGAGSGAAATGGLLYLAFIPYYDGQFAAFNIPYPIWYVTLFWLLGVVCVVRWWESGRGWWWLPAGLCAGVVFAFKPNSGLLHLAALLIALLLLERPEVEAPATHGRMMRGVLRCERVLRWLIPLFLTGGLTRLFTGAGHREVYLFALPLMMVVGYHFGVPRGRRLARPVAPLSIWRNLLLLGSGFTIVTAPWAIYFLQQLGMTRFLRAILFVGTGFDRFYFMGYPPLATWGIAFAAAITAAAAVGVVVRKRYLSARLVGAAIVAGGVAATVLLISRPPLMVEGFQSSVVMRVRDVAFVIILVTMWAALTAYVFQTTRGRALSVAVGSGEAAPIDAEGERVHLGVLAILIVSAILMHMQLYPRTDFMHLVPASPGVLILGAWLLHLLAQIWARGMARSGAARAAVAAAVVAPAYLLALTLLAPALARIAYLAGAWLRQDRGAVVALDVPRAPLVIEPAASLPFKTLAATARYLRRHARPDDPVFGFPVLDIVCFLADRQNPTRHGYFFPGWPGHDVEAEVVDALHAHPPRYIVTLHDHALFFASAPLYYFNLRQFVTGHYHLERRIGTLDILRFGAGQEAVTDGATERQHRLQGVVHLWRAELRRDDTAAARRLDAALAATNVADPAALATTIAELDPAAQVQLVRLIRKSRSAGGAAALAIVLENYRPTPALRQLFLRVVSEVGGPTAIVPLLGALQASDAFTRGDFPGLLYTIAGKLSLEGYWYAPPDRRVLASISEALDLEQVIQWMDNPWEAFALRSFAVRIAGRQQDRRVIPYLMRILGDSAEFTDLRVQAADSLVEMGVGSMILKAVADLMQQDQLTPATLIVKLYAQDPEVGRPALAELMGSWAEATRSAAFWVAAAVHDPGLAEYLRDGLQDRVPEVRIAAAWALGSLGDAASLTALTALTRDSNDQVAEFARQAVDRITKPAAARRAPTAAAGAHALGGGQ